MGTIFKRPRHETYFLSRHMLYLTSQRTKLSGVWCFGILIINKNHCKNNRAKRASGWYANSCTIPHGERPSRVQVHDVCIKSCHSLRRATLLDLSTCSGSLYYQQQCEAKLDSIW